MGIDGIDNIKNLEDPKYVGDETPEAYLKRFMDTPPTRMSEMLDSYISDFQKMVRERLDRICLQALEGGRHGVKVTTNLGDGTMLMEVSEDVPFGEIHYHTEG